MNINFLCFGKLNRMLSFSSFRPRRDTKNRITFPTRIFFWVQSLYSKKYFSAVWATSLSKINFCLGFLHLLFHLLQNFNFLIKLPCCSNTSSAGKFRSHCSRNGRNQEVQKPLLVTLHSNFSLLRLLISSITKHSLCLVINELDIAIRNQWN